jgi:hypothetical protein
MVQQTGLEGVGEVVLQISTRIGVLLLLVLGAALAVGVALQ